MTLESLHYKVNKQHNEERRDPQLNYRFETVNNSLTGLMGTQPRHLEQSSLSSAFFSGD